MGRRAIDLTDQSFGKWTVVKRGWVAASHAHWLCRCECGREKAVSSYDLRKENSKSCGKCGSVGKESRGRPKGSIGKRNPDVVFAGKRCVNCHSTERYLSNSSCVACYRRRYKEKVNEQ